MNAAPAPMLLLVSLLGLWVVIGFLGLLRPTSLRLVAHVLFPLGAVVGVALAATAVASIASPTEQWVLPVGLPDLPVHLRRDALSSVFLFLLGAASAGISMFGAGYFRRGEGTPPGLLCLQYHLFLAAWASCCSPTTRIPSWSRGRRWRCPRTSWSRRSTGFREIRRAGFLYLLIAHVGAIAILLSFGVLQGGSWQFTFDAMRAAELAPNWASAAFLLALVGFGAKAGLVPLHVWLPEAHPAAPSPVSALMSGVMLKTAVYGVLRVTFDLLDDPAWWWGLVAMALGLFSALYGVVFAAVQTDMKRLLAFSSIENVGLLFTGFGLALVFHGVGMSAPAALALIAVLYHAVNHSFMKSLLFVGTGAVLHATGQRNLGRLGGLIHRMPWVAWPTLIGALAIAGLPPLNGFVSEWLLLQAFLSAHEVPRPVPEHAAAARHGRRRARRRARGLRHGEVLRRRVPRAAARGSVGGRPRRRLARAAGMIWLAAGCVLLGLLPNQVISVLALVPQQFGLAASPAPRSAAGGCSTPSPAGRPRTPRSCSCAIVVALRRRHGLRREPRLPPARAPRGALGLRVRAARLAHAGHGRGLRPADPPHLRAVLRHAARAAEPGGSGAALPRRDQRPHLDRPLRAGGRARAATRASRRANCSRAAFRPISLYSFVTLLVLLGFAL